MRPTVTQKQSFSLRGSKYARALSGALVCAALTSCAVALPGTVTSSGNGFTTGADVELTAANDAQQTSAAFHDALEQAFDSQSIETRADAAFIADYALATFSARTGLAEKPGQDDADTMPDWQSQPRKNNRLAKCKPQRMRATLTLYQRSTGQLVYRGTRHADACTFESRDIQAAADDLVSDAIARSRN